MIWCCVFHRFILFFSTIFPSDFFFHLSLCTFEKVVNENKPEKVVQRFFFIFNMIEACVSCVFRMWHVKSYCGMYGSHAIVCAGYVKRQLHQIQANTSSTHTQFWCEFEHPIAKRNKWIYVSVVFVPFSSYYCYICLFIFLHLVFVVMHISLWTTRFKTD